MNVIRRSRPTLPHGAARSRLADHAEAVRPRLYSGCTVREGQNNRLLHKVPQFLLPSSHHSTLTHLVS